ncbi:MAG: methylenetetrahydrofolate reductase C-terminal domain-containing protein [Opitutales bacterium]|nr:methylenetetrahydrofolate reductase C-terminal domain-containing protein [Opitutales bacterium]
MIKLSENLRLREIFGGERPFATGVELVSTRGTMGDQQAIRVRAFGEALTHCDAVDWVSITDNAGGNPQLAPVALGTPILYGGKEVVVHLTCKDLNRHGLESELWMLASQGFHNILAMTGDFPGASYAGKAKPVFDMDSVGLLGLIQGMNKGLARSGVVAKQSPTIGETDFYSGTVTNCFKAEENTLLPQYAKLEKKIASGANFIINQIGFDSRKASELIAYLRWRGFTDLPLIGNVYLLSPFVARLFHQQGIPGVVLSDALLESCDKQAGSPDKGQAFFQEFAAKQIAVYRGLGYGGAYLGGAHRMAEVEAVLNIERSFSPDDWRAFAKEIAFARQNEFYLFEEMEETGLSLQGALNPDWLKSVETKERTANVNPLYTLSKACHSLMFEEGKRLAPLGKKLCQGAADSRHGPAWLRMLERISKSALYDCRDCGDCSLAETAFLCPESQCAKNQRNGPCGGTRNGRCEVFDYECIWSRVYDRMKAEGRTNELLAHAPVVQDQGLRNTSAWANFWLGRDHASKNNSHNPKSKNEY